MLGKSFANEWIQCRRLIILYLMASQLTYMWTVPSLGKGLVALKKEGLKYDFLNLAEYKFR